MPKQVQHRRGTTAQHATFTGALGEITVDTDKKTAVVHDGSTAGGSPVRKEVSIHIRPMDSITANTTFTIAVHAEHYSFHFNTGTTEASLNGTYDITGLPSGFGKDITVFMTIQKGPTTGNFSSNLVLKINGVTAITKPSISSTGAAIFYTTFILREHPVSGLWKGAEVVMTA